MAPRRWFWVFLFVLTIGLLAILATSWNVVLVKHPSPRAQVLGIILGSLGFLGALGALILFFIRLLREMTLSQLHQEFLAQVSHELKTPLATLELTSDLLRKSENSLSAENVKRLWQSHDRELQRLKTEVETLLEMARLEQNASPRKLFKNLGHLSRQTVFIEDWIEASWPQWQDILGESATLKREGEPLKVRFFGNEKLLELILRNLMDNSKKFSGTHGAQVVVRTRMNERHSALLEIEDQGMGFSPRDAKRIFKRFARTGPAAFQTTGTGLGLYFVSRAAKSLGVKITASSPGIGRGAKFCLEIPHG